VLSRFIKSNDAVTICPALATTTRPEPVAESVMSTVLLSVVVTVCGMIKLSELS